MTILRVAANGQVTLRKDMLKHLGVRSSDKVAATMLQDGRTEMNAARAGGRVSDVFGMLKRDGAPALSIQEMNDIIAKGWAGER